VNQGDSLRALRRIYGAGFYLIGVTTTEEDMRTRLQQEKGCTSEEVDHLFERDKYEEDPDYISMATATTTGSRRVTHSTLLTCSCRCEPRKNLVGSLI